MLLINWRFSPFIVWQLGAGFLKSARFTPLPTLSVQVGTYFFGLKISAFLPHTRWIGSWLTLVFDRVFYSRWLYAIGISWINLYDPSHFYKILQVWCFDAQLVRGWALGSGSESSFSPYSVGSKDVGNNRVFRAMGWTCGIVPKSPWIPDWENHYPMTVRIQKSWFFAIAMYSVCSKQQLVL